MAACCRIGYGKRMVRLMSNTNMRVKSKRKLEWEKAEKTETVEKSRGFRALIQKAGKGVPTRLPRVITALALALLCGLYTVSLNEDAVAVISQKRVLPVYSVERQDKVVAISFDASWGGDQTMDILDTLDAYNVKTTFFLVGIWVDKYPDLVKEIVARGHEIGNHSATHPHMSQISEEKIRQELRIMSDQVETLTSKRPTLFRPPYGDYNNKVITTVRQEGYEAVQWSVDSLDWKNRGVEDIIRQCTQNIQSGDIVLFHNDAQYTPQALKTVLKDYQDKGFTIIPVSEILLKGETTIDVQGKQHPVQPVQ